MATWHYPREAEDVTRLLKQRRLDLGYTLADVGRRGKYPFQTVYSVENSEVCPLLHTVDAMFDALDVHILYMVRPRNSGPADGCALEGIGRRCRANRTVSLRALAQITGHSVPTLMRLEHGKNVYLSTFYHVVNQYDVRPLAVRF